MSLMNKLSAIVISLVGFGIALTMYDYISLSQPKEFAYGITGLFVMGVSVIIGAICGDNAREILQESEEVKK